MFDDVRCDISEGYSQLQCTYSIQTVLLTGLTGVMRLMGLTGLGVRATGLRPTGFRLTVSYTGFTLMDGAAA